MTTPRQRSFRHEETKPKSPFHRNRQKTLFQGGRQSIYARTIHLMMLFFIFYVVSCLYFAPVLLRGGEVVANRNDHGLANFDARKISPSSGMRGRRLESSLRRHGNSDNSILALEEDNEDEYFSACILWMDDNHRLEEWLAYHYHFLKLRTVIINVDPRSTTSPQAIVDRWNGTSPIPGSDLDLNMNIVLWNDTMYTNPLRYEFEQSTIDVLKGPKKYEKATEYHKLRQPAFYRACSEHLISEREKEYEHWNNNNIQQKDGHAMEKKKQPSQWTLFYDTDEFFAFAPDGKNANDMYETPGYVLKRLNAIKRERIWEKTKSSVSSDALELLHELESEMKKEKATDPENGTKEFIKLQRQHFLLREQLENQEKNNADETTQTPSDLSCLVIPRYGISSIELTAKETNAMLESTIAQNGGFFSTTRTTSTTTGNKSDALVPLEFVREKLLLEYSKTDKPKRGNGTTILREFDTLRYKYHTMTLENYGKSILDLSQPDVQNFIKGRSPLETHWAIASICGTEDGQNTPVHNKLVKNERMVCCNCF